MRLVLCAVLLALAAGCATHPLNASNLAPGTPREQVLASAGQPTAVVALPGGGQRLQYSLQPFGHDVIMVDLDTAGRVVRARNVMKPSEFHRIEPGRWTREDVLREFGRPAWVDRVQSWQGDVFTYRWKEGNEPMFYWVYFDPQGIARRAHPGIEFINAPDERK
jgi:outer membrane protein assembly factor BamE (lipoprotein component of BamABCDE complex)